MSETNSSDTETTGLKMDFLSSSALNSQTSMEKISMIVDRVKKGDLVVIEGGLTPEEEAELIETTMREIDIENLLIPEENHRYNHNRTSQCDERG